MNVLELRQKIEDSQSKCGNGKLSLIALRDLVNVFGSFGITEGPYAFFLKLEDDAVIKVDRVREIEITEDDSSSTLAMLYTFRNDLVSIP